MDENENQNNSNANAGANDESVGANNNQGQKEKSFDDVLKNKEYQKEFDRRVQQAIQTHEENAKQKAEKEKTEAEKLANMTEVQKKEYELQKIKKELNEANAKNNAHDMEKTAKKIASAKGMDLTLLDLIDFSHTTAEEVNEKLDIVSKAFNTAVEKEVNRRLKEDAPKSSYGANTKRTKNVPRASF